MTKITALIPARGGSKGVYKKNIKPLHGHPLIAYSIVACRMSEMIDKIVVSTDDEEIAEVAIRYGAEVPFMRPASLAKDTSKDFEVIQHYFDRSMHELPESPHKMFQLDKTGYCRGFFREFDGIKNYTNLPRQIFPKAYQPNGYLDIVKNATLDNGDTFGDQILPIITDFVIEVDTPFQFELLENQLASRGHVLLDELKNDNRNKA